MGVDEIADHAGQVRGGNSGRACVVIRDMSAAAARLLLAAVVAAAVVLAVPRPAGACSCAIDDPARMLADADAAFVGALAGRPVETGDFEGDWPFEVEQWVKGGGGTEVDVRSPLDGAACGFEVTRGARVGVLLWERDGLLTGGLCTTIDADVLVAAAVPPGPFDGEGPIALLVAGGAGPYRLVALDAQGRDLARAEGDEPVYQLSVCPGSRYAAELVGQRTLGVRDLATFELTWRHALPGTERWYSAIECRADDGDEVVVLGADQTGQQSVGTVLLVTPDGARELASGPWHEGAFAGDVAVVVTGPERRGLAKVDLQTGESTPLFELAVEEGFGSVGHPAVSPDGTRVAFQAETYRDGIGAAMLHVVDLATGAIVSHPGAGVARWLDDDTLIDDTGSQLKVLYAVEGGEITQIGTRQWDFEPRAVSGSTVYGTRRFGGVIRSAARDGEDTVTLRVLPSTAVYAMAAPVGAPSPQPVVVAAPDPEPEPERPTTTSTRATTSTTATATTPPLAAPDSDDSDGPPWLVLAAISGAAALGGLVWIRRRRSATG